VFDGLFWYGRLATIELPMSPFLGPAVVAATLLVVAGAQKIVDPAPAVGGLRALRVPAGRREVRCLAAVELVVGSVGIAAGGLALLPVSASYLAFTVYVVAAMRSGTQVSSCGCFGREDTPPSGVHVVLNVVFAASAAAAAASGDASVPLESPASTVAFLALAAIGAALAVVAYSRLPRALSLADAAS
jgi:hypothetical protein